MSDDVVLTRVSTSPVDVVILRYIFEILKSDRYIFEILKSDRYIFEILKSDVYF